MTEEKVPPTGSGHNQLIDKNLRSNSTWRILAASTLGTPLLVCLYGIRGLRRQGDTLDMSALPIIAGVATVIGFLVGLTVVAYKKHQRLRATGSTVPWLLRLLFDGQPWKLILIGIPMLFVLAIAIGILMA